MARARRRRLFAPTLVLLALVGTWAAHTLEHLRVARDAGLRTDLFGSVHVYMLPAAAMLLGLSACGSLAWWQRWQAMGRRLDAVRAALAASLRGHRATVTSRGATPSGATRWAALVLLLAGLQLGLYLVQENVEAAVTGAPLPGLGVVLGAHAAAPLVHVAVAVLLATAIAGAGRALARRGDRLAGVIRLLRVLLAGLAPTAPPPAPVAVWRPSPLDRLGPQLWGRPPPTSALAR